MDNRRLLIAALLSVAILFGWQALFPPPKPVPPPAPAPVATAPAAEPAATPAAPAEKVSPAEIPAADATPVAAAAAEEVVLENDLARVVFSNQGAQLHSFELKEKRAEDGTPLELVQHRSTSPYPFALVGADGAAHALDGALFTVERTAGAEPAVHFVYSGPEGRAEKRFRLRGDGGLDFEVHVERAAAWRLLVGPGIRVRKQDELDNRFNKRAAAWSTGSKAEAVDVKGTTEPKVLPGAGLRWIGLEDTYFLSALLPASGLAEARIEPVLLVPAGADGRTFDARALTGTEELSPEEKKLARDQRILLVPAAGELSGKSFWGAKQYDRLSAFGGGLEQSVRWGWLGVLARPMLRALQWIHANITTNYGWGIVLLTVALKIVLLPLSLSAFKSMRKMQQLNPKMQAIRERYRPKLRDKQGRYNAEAQRQMNEEIMGLYRAEGVNPAGGCFPVIVQLPIFFAFYQLLSTAVELWRSPWALWIHDLTGPDPYWVLPIVMGLSQVVQQRMTPPPPDPVQRRMIQAMPIVFTIFSLGFPSGLVLYWLTNNVLSIGQQAIYNSIRERAEAAERGSEPVKAGAAGKRGKKGS